MYKIYENGIDFINDNINILSSDPINLAFFVVDAKLITDFSRNNYIIKVYDDKSFMFLLYMNSFGLMLYGDMKLCSFAVEVLRNHNLQFDKILCEEKLGECFLNEYEKIYGGSHTVSFAFDILKCDEVKECDTKEVVPAKISDCSNIYVLNKKFVQEALGDDLSDYISFSKRYANDYMNYKLIIQNNNIKAMAKRRDVLNISSISNVYTSIDSRGLGYATKIVTALTLDILKSNKIPYLYVDKSNPISNHIYKNIGYKYYSSKSEFKYDCSSIKTIELALGDSKKFIELLKNLSINYIISGYTISLENEKKVKRNSVLIEYDENKVDVVDILDVYFDFIDPHDGNGQYEKRGSYYTCAIFSNDNKAIIHSKSVLRLFEEYGENKVYVPIMNSVVFFNE